MILRSVHLKNIRSYIEATVSFPEGTTLLAGDIGSGKSTILFAVEFALFGALRGALPGETLLRQGTNEGEVTLCLDIDGSPVAITRTLKRSRQGVSQEAGSLVLDGIRNPLTATELKSKMLELIGYSPELLTKSKGLIYRYTVYTPQEDMKRILFDDPEIRLNTLRHVFGIDKYKRIGENAKTYARIMREECRNAEGRIEDLPRRQEQLEASHAEHAAISIQSEEARLAAQACKQATSVIAKTIIGHEAEIKKLTELRSQLAVRANEQRSLLTARSQLLADIDAASKALARIEGDQGGQPGASYQSGRIQAKIPTNGANLPNHTGQQPLARPEDAESRIAAVRDEILALNQHIRTIDQSIRESAQSLGSAHGMAGHCSDLSRKLAEMITCPTCLQPIAEDHKTHISAKEQERLAGLTAEIERHQTAIGQMETSKATLLQKSERLQTTLAAIQGQQAAARHRQDLIERKERLLAQEQETAKRLSDVAAIKTEINRAIFPLEDAERAITDAKTALARAQAQEKEAFVRLARLTSAQEGLERQIAALKEEIRAKAAIKEQLAADRKTLHWIDEGFLKLMVLMEQHVMATVYHSFNDAFTGWFNTLIEDTLMTARLDELFTPVVTQNGHDIGIEHLSGGEKTSLALAYRLALNKVINDLHSTIKTRDLIILDEPTDGFSSEQLDRVRDVMRQLPVRQCILVSHESKIESFVDNIISIEKQGHASRIAG